MLAAVVVLCTVALAAIVHLERNAQADGHAQLRLAGLARQLDALETAPFRARPGTGGSPAVARTLLTNGERRVRQAQNALEGAAPPRALIGLPRLTSAYFGTLGAIYAVGISPAGYGAQADNLSAVSGGQLGHLNIAIAAAGRVYAARARTAEDDMLLGTAAAILVLFCAFAYFHRRSAMAHRESRRLADANGLLLATSREEARTDALTGLPNRRALTDDLSGVLDRVDAPRRVLILFDLDGFKQYNDTFGHPAGDLLLQRLGARLHGAVTPLGGVAYRMGGDEFCVLAPAGDAEQTIWAAWSALSERGDAFEVGASYGVAQLPDDAASMKAALHVADVRLYDDKAAGRPSADRQSTDVLMALMQERGPGLVDHVERVARLTELTAGQMGLSESDTRKVALAARLHDVGHTAIPGEIVDKPGSLAADEWEFFQRHTVIGERIIRAAPALVPVAELVRSSHERFDGRGYPDRLSGAEIPLGSRIISVCDAYDTMTTHQVYQAGVSRAEALAELHRQSGTQFDPQVVAAFCALPAEQVESAERYAA